MNIIKKFILKIIISQIGGSKQMEKIREFLSGKKTYLVMVGLIIAAVVQYIADGDLGKLINSILIAVGGITFRASVSKVS